jgi:hypothetical protein
VVDRWHNSPFFSDTHAVRHPLTVRTLSESTHALVGERHRSRAVRRVALLLSLALGLDQSLPWQSTEDVSKWPLPQLSMPDDRRLNPQTIR